MGSIRIFVLCIRGILSNRTELAAENLALRQQLAILQPKAKRPRLRNRDRIFWVWLSRLWAGWRSVLVIVQPDTVVRWHRQGFRLYWRWKSRPKTVGRPKVETEIRKLIRRMCRENPTWGAPRIHSELQLLGYDVSETTVAKYMVRHRKPPSQTWRAFLDNHLTDIVAIDFFTVPTITFRVLYVLLIMSHDRRRILHFNVTDSPSSALTARQLLEAVPYETVPRYLVRDNDTKFLGEFARCIEAIGIKEVKTAPHSPWQNPYCERLSGAPFVESASTMS